MKCNYIQSSVVVDMFFAWVKVKYFLTFKSFVLSSMTAASKFRSALRSASVKLTSPPFREFINELADKLSIIFWLFILLLCCGDWLFDGDAWLAFVFIDCSLYKDDTLGGPPPPVPLPAPPGVWGVWGICECKKKRKIVIMMSTMYVEFECEWQQRNIFFQTTSLFSW